MIAIDTADSTPAQDGSTQRERRSSQPAATRQRRARRSNLSEEQKREIIRVYSETSTPLPEIRQRYAIGDSSLYRLIQQYGGTLRGRTARADAAKPTPKSPVRRVAASARSTRQTKQAAPASVGGSRFRVDFVGVRVVSASGVREAIAQAERFGANEITAVVRV